MNPTMLLIILQIIETFFSVAGHAKDAYDKFKGVVGQAQSENRDITYEELSQFVADARAATAEVQKA